MVQENAYIKVEYLVEGAVLHIYPPKDGGERVSYREACSYLDGHKLKYDSRMLNIKLLNDVPSEIPLQCENQLEFSDSMYVEINYDKTEAVCRFTPGSSGGPKITVKDIMAGLNQKGVIFGVDQDAIIEFMDKPVYFQDVYLALAQPPEEGKDGYVEYFFNTDHNSKPAYNEDGSVDFHNLDIVSQVDEGQLLAKLHPEERGIPGRDITGREIAPRPVKPAFMSVGRNINLSPDRTEAYSAVTGHAILLNGQVFVSDIYEIPADVDNSTGDIDYNGNVSIKGSVREGFSVTAKGDVVIEGVVEGAKITAGGAIIIKRGVNGMGKGLLEADGNIVSKYIENTKANAGGYIETSSIIHSIVSAKGDIVCNDKKGFITGGIVRSGGKVEAQTIGSTLGADTRIEVGMDPEKKERYNFLDKEIQRINAENAKLKPVHKNYKNQIDSGVQLDPKNAEYYIKIDQTIRENEETLEQTRKEFAELRQLMENSKTSRIIVSKDIFPGVTLVCSDVSTTLREKRSYCYIEKQNGELVIQNL